jgi:Tfp pilus assembly protein PilF
MIQSQVFYKAIIQGRLEFGTEKSYQKIIALYTQRMETLYKRDIIFKTPETIFIEAEKALVIERFIGNSSEKQWKNTVTILEYCAQFAFSGTINAWLADSGKLLGYQMIEPLGEKSMVMLYHEGKKLSTQKGSEKEAYDLLTEAIEKHERHSEAYEKRGYINYSLKNYADAIYDFKKSVHFDYMNASSHYGLARAYMITKEYKLAISSLEETTKHSIALQPIYWAARRVKAECHLALKEYDKSAFEYKLFTARNFTPEDPNFKHQIKSWYNYGKVLFALGQIDAALECFDKSLNMASDHQDSHNAEFFMDRAMARKAAGKSDYILDLRKASELGLETATKLLTEKP